jgi:hypothetical protein
MKKLLSVLVLSVLLFSCSAEESSQTTHSFTIPENFRGNYIINYPTERYGEPVIISAHSININGLIIDTGKQGATDGHDYYNILGAVTDNNGVRTIYGTHDVWMDFYGTDFLQMTYTNIETRESIELGIAR